MDKCKKKIYICIYLYNLSIISLYVIEFIYILFIYFYLSDCYFHFFLFLPYSVLYSWARILLWQNQWRRTTGLSLFLSVDYVIYIYNVVTVSEARNAGARRQFSCCYASRTPLQANFLYCCTITTKLSNAFRYIPISYIKIFFFSLFLIC